MGLFRRAPKKQYVSITIAAGPENTALIQQVTKAIDEALRKAPGQSIGTSSPVSEWGQDGGWFRDLVDPWSQSGGWVQDLKGRVGRLGQVEAEKNPQLTNVRQILSSVQLRGSGQ